MNEKTYHHLLIFVPEGNRKSRTIPVDIQDKWVVRILEYCTKCFGGATAHSRGVGAWKRGTKVYWDRITVIECWIHDQQLSLPRYILNLWSKLEKMRIELHQRQIGCVLNGKLVSSIKEIMRLAE